MVEIFAMIHRLEVRDRLEWMRTGNVMAMIANIHRDPKKNPHPYTWEDFNIYDLEEVRSAPAPVTEDHRNFGERLAHLMTGHGK